MSNPFATERAWEVSTDTILGAGDHACKIIEVDTSQRSSGGYPQAIVKSGNQDGATRDWMVITPNSYGKVVQLIQAVGLAPPTDSEVEVDEATDTTVPTDAYWQKFVDKPVGVVIRPEPDFNDPTRTRDRVRGYVPVGDVTGSDATPAGAAAMFDTTPKPQSAIDDDIPF
jgi:hypothetical protein